MALTHALYTCDIEHVRKRPRHHRFRYQSFLFYIDIGALDTFDAASAVLSVERPNLYSLRRNDHLNEGGHSIRDNVLRFLAKNSALDFEPGSIHLLTSLRTLGHVFNPVSFFYVRDDSDRLRVVVAEVANTHNEQKLYIVDPNAPRQAHDKHFYVSPYSDLDTQFRFRVSDPSETLQVSIDQIDNNGLFFNATMHGTRLPLDSRSLLRMTARFPLSTLKVVGAIHWQALRLRAKGLRFRDKRENPQLQRGIRTYLPARSHK